MQSSWLLAVRTASRRGYHHSSLWCKDLWVRLDFLSRFCLGQILLGSIIQAPGGPLSLLAGRFNIHFCTLPSPHMILGSHCVPNCQEQRRESDVHFLSRPSLQCNCMTGDGGNHRCHSQVTLKSLSEVSKAVWACIHIGTRGQHWLSFSIIFLIGFDTG